MEDGEKKKKMMKKKMISGEGGREREWIVKFERVVGEGCMC